MENHSYQPCQKILIVEDEEMIRESIREYLEIEGYSVATAQNGKEAFSLLEKMSRPCLILLDLVMPIWDGFKFLAARAQSQKLSVIPVIVVSAYPEKAATLHAVGFLEKPVHFSKLLQKVEEYCRGLPAADQPESDKKGAA